MSAVQETAKSNDWRVFSDGDPRRRREPGFPNLVLCREKVIFAHLQTAPLTEEQRSWIGDLLDAGQDARVVTNRSETDELIDELIGGCRSQTDRSHADRVAPEEC